MFSAGRPLSVSPLAAVIPAGRAEEPPVPVPPHRDYFGHNPTGPCSCAECYPGALNEDSDAERTPDGRDDYVPEYPPNYAAYENEARWFDCINDQRSANR